MATLLSLADELIVFMCGFFRPIDLAHFRQTCRRARSTTAVPALMSPMPWSHRKLTTDCDKGQVTFMHILMRRGVLLLHEGVSDELISAMTPDVDKVDQIPGHVSNLYYGTAAQQLDAVRFFYEAWPSSAKEDNDAEIRRLSRVFTAIFHSGTVGALLFALRNTRDPRMQDTVVRVLLRLSITSTFTDEFYKRGGCAALVDLLLLLLLPVTEVACCRIPIIDDSAAAAATADVQMDLRVTPALHDIWAVMGNITIDSAACRKELFEAGIVDIGMSVVVSYQQKDDKVSRNLRRQVARCFYDLLHYDVSYSPSGDHIIGCASAPLLLCNGKNMTVPIADPVELEMITWCAGIFTRAVRLVQDDAKLLRRTMTDSALQLAAIMLQLKNADISRFLMGVFVSCTASDDTSVTALLLRLPGLGFLQSLRDVECSAVLLTLLHNIASDSGDYANMVLYAGFLPTIVTHLTNDNRKIGRTAALCLGTLFRKCNRRLTRIVAIFQESTESGVAGTSMLLAELLKQSETIQPDTLYDAFSVLLSFAYIAKGSGHSLLRRWETDVANYGQIIANYCRRTGNFQIKDSILDQLFNYLK